MSAPSPSAPRARRPWPMWIVVVLFVVAAASIPAIVQWKRQSLATVRVSDDWDVPKLVEVLHERGMNIQVVADMDVEALERGFLRSLSGGALLIDSDLHADNQEDLMSGTLYVQCNGLPFHRPSWTREAAMVLTVGKFHFYGDRSFAEKISRVLRP